MSWRYARQDALNFNANDSNDFSDQGSINNRDNRSDDKGPEPETIVVGNVNGKSIAFIGLERMGGVMIYDVSAPAAPSFESFANRRNFDAPNTVGEEGSETTNPEAGDLAVEGMVFIAAADSPIPGVPLLVTANEVSGTTTIFAAVDVAGDLDQDGELGAADIDFLFSEARSATPDLVADLNGDRRVSHEDRDRMIIDLLKTSYGDANLDRVFDSNDLLQISSAGEFEDDIADNSTWITGDFDGDGDFTTQDLVFIFSKGTFAE